LNERFPGVRFNATDVQAAYYFVSVLAKKNKETL
jgi:hypothetical protein